MQEAIAGTNDGKDTYCHKPLPGHNELTTAMWDDIT